MFVRFSNAWFPILFSVREGQLIWTDLFQPSSLQSNLGTESFRALQSYLGGTRVNNQKKSGSRRRIFLSRQYMTHINTWNWWLWNGWNKICVCCNVQHNVFNIFFLEFFFEFLLCALQQQVTRFSMGKENAWETGNVSFFCQPTIEEMTTLIKTPM